MPLLVVYPLTRIVLASMNEVEAVSNVTAIARERRIFFIIS